jgi:predicted nucleotidyltransferase
MRNKKNTMQLSFTERQALHDIVKVLQGYWQDAHFILFGSKVQGTADDESDVDLLIVLPCPVTPEIRRQIVYTVFDINLLYESNISALIVSAEEWEHTALRVLPIHAVVEHEGVPL